MVFPRELMKLARVFKENDFSCYCVGGAVRDMILGRKVTDYDIATDALPENVRTLFRRTIPTGIKHGTVTVLVDDRQYEITTFRTDGQYSDSRKPDYVTFTPSIEEDLKRRDFTINAIAYDLVNDRILDPHQGRTDLKKRIIRAIGDPLERFTEDALRLLRACRFSSQLSFELEKETEDAMRMLAKNIVHVSFERIRDEIVKIVTSSDPVRGIEYMKDSGLLVQVLPELAECAGIEQRELHCFDVYYHSVYSCEAEPTGDPVLRLAALFHDLGKAKTLVYSDAGVPMFYNHEKASAELVETIMKRLKFPTSDTRRASHLVLHHMFNYTDEWSDSAVRRFINRVGTEHINDLLSLRQADQGGMCRKNVVSGRLLDFKDRIRSVIDANEAVTISDLAIGGNDVMDSLGIKPGPVVGTILEYLLESVMDDPEQNTRDTLLRIARSFYDQRIAHNEARKP